MNGAFPQTFVWRNDISTAQGKKWWTEVRSHHFFPRVVEISFFHTQILWIFHSHNKGFLMQKHPFIPARDFSFLLCIYLHFICFVENFQTSLRKIYEQVPPGINGYFYIRKILYFDGNWHLILRGVKKGKGWLVVHLLIGFFRSVSLKPPLLNLNLIFAMKF